MEMNQRMKAFLGTFFCLSLVDVDAFTQMHHNMQHTQSRAMMNPTSKSFSSSSTSTSLRMNFFKNLIGDAFENDPNLTKDKSEGQLEGPNDSDNAFKINSNAGKTDVQKRWLESQAQSQLAKNAIAAKGMGRSNVGGGYGAPMNPDLLPGTKWKLSLYLTGIPMFDPSNSLFGAKTNISTRRDSSLAKDGFAIGADVLPEEASVEVEMTLLENNCCVMEEGAFTPGNINGEWKLSEDERSIRFSMDVSGYERTVTTMGTIQNVAWSDRDEAARRSSATYAIEPGLVYADARVGYGSKPGVFVMAQMEGNTASGAPGGLLQVERSMGVFGVRTTMLACGKFSAEMIVD